MTFCVHPSYVMYFLIAKQIYVWKIVQGLVPNLSDPITFSYRRGRTCVLVQNRDLDSFFSSKCFNSNKIELNGQIKIILHLPKSINPVPIYLNLKIVQNLAFLYLENVL